MPTPDPADSLAPNGAGDERPIADVGAATDPAGSAPAAPTRWLNRNVLGMGLTSLLSDASHEMATSVMAGFLAVIGAPVYVLGLIEGAADAVSSFVKLGAGYWGDRLGHRKAIATGGYALTGMAFGLFALAMSWPLVLVGRVVGWLGRGIRGPLRDAILAESIAPGDRGKAFGFHRAGDTLGAILGPLAAAALMFLVQPMFPDDPSRPFRIVFLVTIVPGVGAALAFVAMVAERRRAANHAMRFWASLGALPRNFRRLLVGVGLFGAGDFAHTLLILAATQLLAAEYGSVRAAQIAALLYALRNVVYAGASYPVGALSDRVGARGLLVLGYLLGAVVMLGFAATFLVGAQSVAWLGVLFAAAGVYIAVEDSLEGVLTAELVGDVSIRGTAYGVMGTVNGLGDFVSSAAVGVLWAVHPAVGFAYAAAAMLSGAILLDRLR